MHIIKSIIKCGTSNKKLINKNSKKINLVIQEGV
tara:strand:+ start:189 stop:290 length:102 start_codon:yes stop_codon:yes gene_type:complete